MGKETITTRALTRRNTRYKVWIVCQIYVIASPCMFENSRRCSERQNSIKPFEDIPMFLEILGNMVRINAFKTCYTYYCQLWIIMCCVSIQCDNHFIKGVRGYPALINQTKGPSQTPPKFSWAWITGPSALYFYFNHWWPYPHFTPAEMLSTLMIIHFQNITTRAGKGETTIWPRWIDLLRNKQAHSDTFGKHTAYSNMSLLENILGVVCRCAIIIENKNDCYDWLILLLI